MKRTTDRNPSTPGRDQRRSPRYPWTVLVELTHGTDHQVLNTVDVCQHGLFVATDRPPRERFLVQLVIHLPDGPLPATAFVSRSVTRHGPRVPGVGLQLFALGSASKGRWDRFIQSLGGTVSPSAIPEPVKVPRDVERPTFLLKLRDGARLVEFYEKNVLSGGLYLATPVIKEPGTEVGLIVIHPVSEHEMMLLGRVERVHRDRPKGMEIRLHPPLSDEERAAFRQFVATGMPSASGGGQSTDSLDIVIEEPVNWDRPQFEWREVSEDLIVDFDLSEYETGQPAEAISVDLDDLAAPEASPETAPVPPSNGVGAGDSISVHFTTPVEIGEGESADEVSTDLESSLETHLGPVDPVDAGADATGDFATRPLARELDVGHEPPLHLRVSCSKCDAPPNEVTIGGVEGMIGLLARARPYWCPRCEKIVAVNRLKPNNERRLVLARLGGARSSKLKQPIELSFAFEVASLAGASPRCPACSGTVRVNQTIRAIELALLDLDTRDQVELPRTHCPACGEDALVLERAG